MQKAITGVFVLIILSIPVIAYQAFVVIPKEKMEASLTQAKLELEEKRIAEERRKESYDQCISSAWETYSSNWDQSCEVVNLKKDCTLPAYLSTGLDDRHEQSKDRCVALYK